MLEGNEMLLDNDYNSKRGKEIQRLMSKICEKNHTWKLRVLIYFEYFYYITSTLHYQGSKTLHIFPYTLLFFHLGLTM